MLKTIEQKVLKFILEYNLVEPRDKVLVALSGGTDSVFLLSFLLKYKRRLKIDIGVFHLNHNLRGTDSKNDEEFCRQLSDKNNAAFYSSGKNVKLYAKRKKISIEEAGREIRYLEFKKCAKENQFSKIATAHHSDDNAETVLLNLFKGTGLKGLTGIPVRRDNIIRPLLVVSKDEIENYLRKKKIDFCFDSSNLENDYQRNYLRNEIVPLIKNKFNPQLGNAVLRMSRTLKNISDFVENKVNDSIKSAVEYKNERLIINLCRFTELDAGLQCEVLKKSLTRYFQVEMEHQNIIDLKNLAFKQTGKSIELSKDLSAKKEREYLFISKSHNLKERNKHIFINTDESKQISGRLVSIRKLSKIPESFALSPHREYISADNINGKFLIRSWQNGDKFYPLGMKNAKKVSDFLNEQKIESFRKREHLVLINSQNIVWVVGLRIDDRYKITKRTKKVLELCLN